MTGILSRAVMGLRAPAVGLLGAVLVVASGFAAGVLWNASTDPSSAREVAPGATRSSLAATVAATGVNLAPLAGNEHVGAASAEKVFAFVARALSAEQVDGPLSQDRVMTMLDAALSSIDAYGGVVDAATMKTFFAEGSDDERVHELNRAASGQDASGLSASGLGASGLGVYFLRGASPPAVSGVAPGSAAELAGIRPGDHIVSIDGRMVASEAEVVDYISAKVSAALAVAAQEVIGQEVIGQEVIGQEGAAEMTSDSEGAISPQRPRPVAPPPFQSLPVVSLSVSRAGVMRTVEARLTRWRDGAAFVFGVDGDIALIRIRTFLPGAAGDIARAQAQAALFIGRPPSGMVLDLRGNGGGSIDEALLSAALFLPPGAPFHTCLARPGAAPGGLVAVPLVEGVAPFSGRLAVLIDDQTASSAEMLASALRAGRGAPLVGRKTKGKGSIQRIMEIPGAGYGVRFTVSHYLGAAGEIIDGVGLAPDVAVAPHLADQAALRWLSGSQ